MNNTPKPSNEFVNMIADAQQIALLLEAYHARQGDIEKAQVSASFAKLAETVIETLGSKNQSVTLQEMDAAVNAAQPQEKRSQPLDIPWNDITDHYQYAVMNEHGMIYLYSRKPRLVSGMWHRDGEMGCCVNLLNSQPEGLDWRESLTERPE